MNERFIQEIADKYDLPPGDVEDVAELLFEDKQTKAEIEDLLNLEILAAQESTDAEYEIKTLRYLPAILKDLNALS